MHGARAVLRASSGPDGQEIDAGLVWAFESSMSTCRDSVPSARPHLLTLLIPIK